MNGLLKFITCGSVDDGKSTLLGHILYDAKLLYADQEKALLLDSKAGSRGGDIDYSLLLDGLIAEREQGITIDVAYRYFTTDKRSFIAADTPGHEEYTRNMAVGASFASLAVVMVDAVKGVLVQTRRHSRICSLMGIRHFVFAVNKMDLAGYSEERFRQITEEIEELAQSLNLQDVKIIPVSATEGDNVTTDSKNMPWYHGGSLLSWLENVDADDADEQEEESFFYMPVQRVCRPDHEFRGFQGQAEAGEIHVGDRLYILPSYEEAGVKSILAAGKNVETAYSGQPLTIQLDKEVDVSRGSVLAAAKELNTASKVRAVLLWMDDEPLKIGKEYLLKLGTRKISARIQSINYKTDVNTGEHSKAGSIGKNEIGSCELAFSEKIPAAEFKKQKTLGELILIDRISHSTCACGVVEELIDEKDRPYFHKGNLKAGGSVFEELFYDLGNDSVGGRNNRSKTYQPKDSVPVKGESFEYPDYFDILCMPERIAVQIRDQIIQDILPLEQYIYTGLPVLDKRGFELKIRSRKDYLNFVGEYEHSKPENTAEVINYWSRFETYRHIFCTNSFWVI